MITYQATVRYQYGTYSGEETIISNSDDSEYILARFWSMMRRRGLLTLPMAYQSATITKIDEY
jgi:hypothetical protein